MASYKSHKLSLLRVLIPLVSFGLGVLAMWAIFQVKPLNNTITEGSVRLSGQYKLISPLLLCSSTESKDLGQYQDLQTKLTNLVNTEIKSGNATSVSIYFRDFGGKWVGINDDEQYAPASLLKVPIMIAYYKEAESNPSILSKQLTYTGGTNQNDAETFSSSKDLTPGTYTVDELIKAMIVSSDNNAADILYSNMDKSWLAEVYTDLGLTLTPGGSSNTEDITAKQYSYFFRILYNATYLTPAYSEKSLELLEGADFPQGLESTVPSTDPVANKFGERSVYTPTGTLVERELHDCGIIYTPSKPYLLCVMTRGQDFTALTNIIDSIGKITYSEVTSAQ